ncbi:MAG: TetR/AcrR family transcriptional regulator [Pseudonocardia sp.]
MTSSSPRGRRGKPDPVPPGTDGGESRSTTARRELVENEIYEHATRLFAERGFAGTSLQDIANALGITRPALYYYVRSKDELLAKLVTEVTHGPLQDLEELLARPGLDAVGKLRGVVGVIVARRTTQPERFRLLIRSEAELPEELASAYDASRRAVLRTVATIVEEGVRAGVFRPVDSRVAALGVLGMCNWVAWWFQPGGRDGADAVAEQFADMVVAGLSRDGDRALDGEGPAAAVKMLRQDLDHLERLLDL